MEKRKLYPYQSRAAWHLFRHPRQALFAGLGSGKTGIVLHVLEKLLVGFEIQKVLVVAPVAVCKAVWRQEAQVWPKTRWLRFSLCVGNAKQREKALKEDAEIYLINYESLPWLINRSEIKEFDTLVLDESTMVQNASSVRFAGKGRRLNPKYEEGSDLPKWLPPVTGLKKVVGNFDRVHLMTGTPKPGEYMGLWSQMFCLDLGKALQPTITKFRQKYYYRYGPEFYHIKLRDDDCKKEIQRLLKPLCYRIPSKEVAAVLPKVTERTYLVDLPAKAKSVYDELKEDFFAEIDDQPITVENIAIRSNKLQQVCQGAVYDDNKNVVQIHKEKIDMLDALLTDLGGRNALVIYSFRHDLDNLLKFRKFPVLKSRASEKELNQIIDGWNAGKYPVVYGHPGSMSHGLNLQGGGFDVIFFGLTWSLDRYQQTIGRLRRNGQKNDVVFVHRIACRNSVEDWLMLPRLRERGESQREFLKSFNRYKKRELNPL